MYRDIHGNMFPILISVTVNSFIIDIGFLRYVEKRLTVKKQYAGKCKVSKLER